MSCVVVLLPVSCPTIAILASFEDQVYHPLRRRQGKLSAQCSVQPSTLPKEKALKNTFVSIRSLQILLYAYSSNILLPKKFSKIKPWPQEDEKYDKKVST